jgi:signal transduction histidine kinase/ActR/RegA family two-component response regulator
MAIVAIDPPACFGGQRHKHPFAVCPVVQADALGRRIGASVHADRCTMIDGLRRWPPRDHEVFLQDLRDRLRHEGDPAVILAETTERLARHFEASRAGYGEFDRDATIFIPRYHWVDGSIIEIPETIPFAIFGPAITASHRRGEIWIHEEIDAPHPLLDEEGRAALRQFGIEACITVPIVKDGRLVSLMSVQQSEPRRWRKEDVALIVELAQRTWETLERARVEEELARSREALFQAEKLNALGTLLAGVSHELNNPLSIIVAQSELLAQDTEGTAFATRVAKIRNAAERSARIVQTFLAMARQKQPDRRIIDLNDIVRAAVEIAGYATRARHIAVDLDLAPLPPLRADGDQLHQVIVNLLINAQQAMEGVSGARCLRIVTRLRDAQTITIDLSDTGPGVTPALRGRIFEPFFSTKPALAGTGMGLSFSQGIVEAHGGSLELIASTVGACFRITLPIAYDGTVVPVAETALTSDTLLERRALLIDDEPEVAEALADILARLGYRCSHADSGPAARALLEHDGFDLILSDLRMAEEDGMQLFRWLEGARPDLTNAVAFVTGDTLNAAAAAFLGESGRPFIEKPFTIEAIARLAQIVADHQSGTVPFSRS